MTEHEFFFNNHHRCLLLSRINKDIIHADSRQSRVFPTSSRRSTASTNQLIQRPLTDGSAVNAAASGSARTPTLLHSREAAEPAERGSSVSSDVLARWYAGGDRMHVRIAFSSSTPVRVTEHGRGESRAQRVSDDASGRGVIGDRSSGASVPVSMLCSMLQFETAAPLAPVSAACQGLLCASEGFQCSCA